MHNPSLCVAVEKFASSTQAFTNPDLERPWNWQGYEEGIRFAFFRTYEQLCQLAARLETERAASHHPFTAAHRILGQYHTAYRDLQAVLLGVTDELATQAPAQGEWPVRQALAHIVQADRGFFTANYLSLEHIRAGKADAFEINDEIWNNFWAEAPFSDLGERGALSEIQAYYTVLHARILRAFAGVTGEELDLPIKYWESTPMPLEFRLHRFSSHLRQHTIQIEKALSQLGQPPSEARRLLRMIYNPLAVVESANIGDDGFGLAQQNAIAAEIELRRVEIIAVVK
jgi:hypothetical protein